MANTDALTHMLSSDVYSIADAVNNLKAQYVDEDEQTLAMGIFGYIGSMETAKIQTAITMASELSNEVFPNRAKYDRNIITHAMLYDIVDIDAIPATLPAVIYIRKSDIELYSVNDKFIIDKNCSIFIDDPDDPSADSYEFHLFYDVILSKVTINYGEEVYTARYDNSVPNNLSNITNPYLNAPISMRLGGETYIGVQVTLCQVKLDTYYGKMNSSNLIDNKTFIFTHEDQLADFMVYVTENGITTAITPIYEGGTVPKNVEHYCYYLFLDSEKVRVKFERVSYSPGINAEINVKMQTTKGKSGNFRYSTSAIFATLNSESNGYNNLQSMVYIQGDSENGLDSKSSDELKSIIPREALARGAITTTKDVENYFNQLNTDDNKILPTRKVDNQIERTYYAHLLLKDTNNDIIPTNTIRLDTRNCDYPISSNHRFVIPAGAIIEYDAAKEVGYLIYKDIDENGIEDVVKSIDVELDDHDPVILPNGETLEDDLQKINDAANDALKVLEATSKPSENAETNLEEGIEDYVLSTEQVNPDNPPTQESTGENYDTIVFTADETQGGNGCVAELDAEDSMITDPVYKVVDNLLMVKPIDDPEILQFMYLVTDEKDLEIDNNDHTKFYYTNPYTIIINTGDQLYAAYYLCVVDDIKITNYKYINQQSDIQFISNQLEWYRKFITDSNTYKLDISFTQNIQDDLGLYAEEVVKDAEGNETTVVLAQKVKAFLVLYRNGNPYRYCEGEFKSFYKESYTFNFQFRLVTKNIILDTDNNIRIENLGLCGQEGTDYGYFPGNTKANIYVLIDDGGKAGRGDLNDIIVSGIDNYSVTNMFEVNDGVNFFVNYSGIMSSKIDATEGTKSQTETYTITSLPVIGYQYAMQEGLFDDFVNQLNYKKAYIDNANEKMENSFGVDFKFYNTYGPSKLFTLDNNEQYINRVNIQLNFRVKLASAYDVYTVDYIKEYVKSAIVENLNNEDSLHIPNLITNVTNKYRESLVFFEFLGVDNYGPGVQHLYHKDVDYVEMVPEFININMLYDENGSKTPDINIEVV